MKFSCRLSRASSLVFLMPSAITSVTSRVSASNCAAVGDFFHAANRELLYARERLRATRISDPKDLTTFFKTVLTRLTPAEDPDLYSNVGVRGAADQRGNIFAGVYAPGSVVKLWDEEATRAAEVVDDNASQGWRNEIFDVQARSMF